MMERENFDVLLQTRLTQLYKDEDPNLLLARILCSGDAVEDVFGLEICQSIKRANQSEIFDIIERNRLDDFSSVMLLALAVKNARSDSAWLLYNLTKNLDIIVRRGLSNLRPSLIMYSLLTLSSFEPLEEGRPLPLSILARELANFAPRIAVAYGIDSAMMGYIEGLDAAHGAIAKLGFHVSSRPTMNQIEEISSGLCFNCARPVALTDAIDATGYTETVFKEKEFRVISPPDGDSEHYIFRNANIATEVPPIKIHSFDGGFYSIDISYTGRTTFYVFDSDKRCVVDLSHGVNPFILSECLSIDATVCIIDDFFSGAMNICHFILDRITRFGIYENASDDDLVFVMADKFSYYKDLIKIAGLSDRVVFLNEKKSSIRCRRLLVSSNANRDFVHPAHSCASWAIDYIDSLFMRRKSLDVGKIKLLISRTDAKGRAILNWEEVLELCTQYGFYGLSLTELPVEEQIALFQRADHVIGVHGAGLTNIVFADTSCRVLEILPPLVATEAYWRLSVAKKQHYTALIGDDPTGIRPDYLVWHHDPMNNHHDVIVPLDKLRQYLDAS